MSHQKQPIKIGPEDVPPSGKFVFGYRDTWSEQTRIVHQDIDGTEVRNRLSDDATYIGRLCDVAASAVDDPTAKADLLDCAHEIAMVAPADKNFRAMIGISRGHRPADAATATSDQHNLA
jgi:hypothetical protein